LCYTRMLPNFFRTSWIHLQVTGGLSFERPWVEWY